VDHSRDEQFALFHDMDDPVAVRDQFADALVFKLRDFAAREWKLGESSRQSNDPPDNGAGVRRRIGGDVRSDSLHVGYSAETRLLGEPLAQPLFHFFLSERAMLARILQPMSHLVQNIEMILDAFKGAIFREFVQK
jgi:hypothetical protein